MKDVYTLADLENREILDQGADKPARLAVIGKPIAHSASPVIHQAALDQLNIDSRYIRIEVEPGEVENAFQKMAALNFIGCNVTVPHKLEATTACNKLSEDAKAIGAVNTVTFDCENNLTIGHNTDAPGLVLAIREDFSVDLRDLKVLILGAGGGAGRAAAIQCARIGCDQVWLANRSVDKVERLAKQLTETYGHSEQLQGPGDRFTPISLDSSGILETVQNVELIINATSLGLKASDPLPLPRRGIQPFHLVYDMVYQPPVTSLIRHAQEIGARAANGKSLLLHQGALAFENWINVLDANEPLASMRRGLEKNKP